MEIARHWRLRRQRYGLVGDVCKKGHVAFPPDDVCKQCKPKVAVADAVSLSVARSEREITDIKAKIIIYEANPDKYESLDEIQLD